METKSATKKPSFLGSFFDKAKTFNFSSLSKASSDIGSPGLQESPKFKRKSVLLTGTFGPTQYDQTPTRLTEKALVTPRALTSDVIKLDPNEGDADSMVSPETLPDFCFQSDTPLSPISVTDNTKDVARIRIKFDANADVRPTTKSENNNANRQSSAIKPTEEMGVVEEGDSKEASPRSKGSPRHIFDIAENEKEVDSIVSSAYFGKLSLATPSHSMQKSVTGKKDFAKESEAKTSDADTMNEMGTNLSKKVSLTQGLSLRNHKSSFLRFLPGANDTKGDESPAVRTKDLTLTSLVGLSPLKYKSQSKKSIPELSMSMALQQIDKTDGELVKSPTIKSTMEDTIIDNVPRSVAIKLALLNIFGLLVFGAITFGLLTVVATVVTVPYGNEELALWIDYFFQGFFLGGLATLFFKGAIRIAIKEAEESKKKMHLEEKSEKPEKKSRDLDLHILSGVLTICTGFSMLGMGKNIPDVMANRLYFILINAGLLFILGTIFTVYFDIKNRIKSKKVHGHKTHGYFAVRVYRNFISDLYTTRGMLNRVESTVTSPDGSRKDIKISMSKINEEGIDKYRHKHSFEIVTTLKIWGSQLIIMIAYIQFIAIIGLIKLYDSIQEHEDGYLETIPLLLAYPVILYIFAKLVEVVDRKTQVNMIAHGYYMDAAFAAIFYQIVRYSFTDLNSLWVMIGCKAFYKAVVYIVFGVKADFWKVTVVEKIKAKFRKSKETDAHEAPKKRDAIKMVKLFALRFALIEIGDIFYGLVSLILALIKQNVNYDIFFDFVNNEHKDNYIKSTWIEIAVDSGLLLLVLLCWSCSKAYKKIQIGGVLKQYFMPYFGDYMYITLVQLISFLCLVHKV